MAKRVKKNCQWMQDRKMATTCIPAFQSSLYGYLVIGSIFEVKTMETYATCMYPFVTLNPISFLITHKLKFRQCVFANDETPFPLSLLFSLILSEFGQPKLDKKDKTCCKSSNHLRQFS